MSDPLHVILIQFKLMYQGELIFKFRPFWQYQGELMYQLKLIYKDAARHRRFGLVGRRMRQPSRSSRTTW